MKLAGAGNAYLSSVFLPLAQWRRRGNAKETSSGCLILAVVLLFASPVGSADLRPGEIVTVLPKDAIPAIMSPSFDKASEATWLRGNGVVVGVKIGDDARAYPVSILSRHEIVNDKIGVLPFAVTW